MDYQVMSYRTENGGTRTVITGPTGRKYFPVLMMTSPTSGPGLVVKRLPLSEQRYLSTLHQNGRRKSLRHRVGQFRAFGKRTGMTKAAKSFLTEANRAA